MILHVFVYTYENVNVYHDISDLSYTLWFFELMELDPSCFVCRIIFFSLIWWFLCSVVFLWSSGDQYEPSFYKLTHGNTSVCLATGFSRFHQLLNKTFFKQTEAVLISQDSLFNQVAFMTKGVDEESNCPEGANK